MKIHQQLSILLLLWPAHNYTQTTTLPANAHVQIGDIYREHNAFDDAIVHYKNAYAQNTRDLNVLLKLANTYNIINEHEHALALYKKGMELAPQSTTMRYNAGYSLRQMGKNKEAIEFYEQTIKLNPHYAKSHFSLGLSLLQLGNFERGWQEHEWRWAAYDEKPPEYKKPVWDGSDPKGKTIFITCEQGLGDTFQFIRYAQLLKEKGAQVLVQTQSPLKTILQQCPYIDRVVSVGDILPDFDFHVATMSLPLLFKTQIDTVPANIPYLYAKPELVAYWQKELATDTNFKIGLCWHGNPNYSTQALRETVKAKSCHVHTFLPLADIKGISLYSLQKVGGTDQLKELNGKLTIKEFTGDFDNTHGRFMDTAAVIKQLDLVITIDTSIAHFAAALGTPTWVLLPEPADWRWIIGRNDTPWYPNMRLFKQHQRGDWQSAMHDITTALKQELKKRISS